MWGRSLALATCLLAAPAFANSLGGEPQGDWRLQVGTFRIGIVADDAVATRLRLRPFSKSVETALDLPVEVVAVPDQASLAQAHIDGRLDYAVYSALGFAAAQAACKCVEPLAVARTEAGASAFRVVVLARPDGPGSLSALAGRTVLTAGPGHFAGDMALGHFLPQRGVALGANGVRLEGQGSQENALAAFAAGEGDALSGWVPEVAASEGGDGTLAELRRRGINARIVWRSPPIPHGPHAVRRRLPAQAKARLRELLLAMTPGDGDVYDVIEPRNRGGLVPARAGDYAPLVKMVQALANAAMPR